MQLSTKSVASFVPAAPVAHPFSAPAIVQRCATSAPRPAVVRRRLACRIDTPPSPPTPTPPASQSDDQPSHPIRLVSSVSALAAAVLGLAHYASKSQPESDVRPVVSPLDSHVVLLSTDLTSRQSDVRVVHRIVPVNIVSSGPATMDSNLVHPHAFNTGVSAQPKPVESKLVANNLVQWPRPPTDMNVNVPIPEGFAEDPTVTHQHLFSQIYPRKESQQHFNGTLHSNNDQHATSQSPQFESQTQSMDHNQQQSSSQAPASVQTSESSENTSAEKRERVPQSPSPYQTNASVMSEFSQTIRSSSAATSATASSTPSLIMSRPGAVGLVGGIAITSTTSYLIRRRRLSQSSSSILSVPTAEQLVSDACTVVCMRIPFCVSERQDLLKNLNGLVESSGSVATPAALAQACRKAANLVENEAVTGVLEDSTKFGPHVDVFIAQTFKEAERRFCAHVNIEGDRVEKLTGENAVRDQSNGNGVSSNNNESKSNDYGVIVMVVATTEGVNLKCYDDDADVSNLTKLRCALEALRRVKEGEITGLELVWAPEQPSLGGLSRSQMIDAYPGLRIH